MRLVTALVSLLILSTAPRAQTAADFYPLDVGNEWVYTFDYADGNGPRLQHDRIVGTTTEGGAEYTQRERCDVPFSEFGLGTPDCVTQLVRVDADGDLVIRQPDGTEREEACALGTADGTVTTCDVPGPSIELTVTQTGVTTIVIGYQEVTVDAVQVYDGSVDPVPAGFAVGIGRLAGAVFDSDAVSRFEYARIGDAEYGVNPLDPDPASFDPLSIGTVREYIRPISTVGGYFTREDAVRTVEMDGETWTLRRTQERSLTTSTPYTRDETRQLVRYDAASANVLVRQPDGSTYPLHSCSLDGPVGENPDCTYSFLALNSRVVVGGEVRQAATIDMGNLGFSQTLAAGLGFVAALTEAAEADYDVRYIDVAPLPTGDPLPLGTPFGDIFPTEPDPTPAHRYYPLSVGDEWHDEYGEIERPQLYRQRLVAGTEQIDGETYFVVETATAEPGDAAWTPEGSFSVRYDSLSAHIVRPNGSTLTTCSLDEPINVGGVGSEEVVLCNAQEGEPGAGYAAFGGLLPGSTRSAKTFGYYGIADGVDPEIYQEGIGFIPNRFGAISTIPYARLAYARVRQDDGSVLTVGEVVVADESAPPTAALAVTASPNPTAGALRLAIEMPTAATLTVEAFDALGRRVFSDARDAAVGALDLSLDASGWAPGVYIVRVRTADGVATARVVRR